MNTEITGYRNIAELPLATSALVSKAKLLINTANNGGANLLLDILPGTEDISILQMMYDQLNISALQSSLSSINTALNEFKTQINNNIEVCTTEDIEVLTDIGSLPQGYVIPKGTTINGFIKQLCGYGVPKITSIKLNYSETANGPIVGSITKNTTVKCQNKSYYIQTAELQVTYFENINALLINGTTIDSSVITSNNITVNMNNLLWDLSALASTEKKKFTVDGISTLNNTIEEKSIELKSYLPIYVAEIPGATNFTGYTIPAGTFTTELGTADKLNLTLSLPYNVTGYDVYLLWAIPNYLGVNVTGYGNSADFAFSSGIGVEVVSMGYTNINGNSYSVFRSSSTVANETIYIRK